MQSLGTKLSQTKSNILFLMLFPPFIGTGKVEKAPSAGHGSILRAER
jgi:hypothetical protein